MKQLYNALSSKGFIKTFLYSTGSFLIGWIILFVNDKDVALSFGKYAGVIPIINIVAVYLKQSWDEYKKS